MQDVAKGIVQLEGQAKDLVMSSLPAATYRMLEKVAAGAGTRPVTLMLGSVLLLDSL